MVLINFILLNIKEREGEHIYIMIIFRKNNFHFISIVFMYPDCNFVILKRVRETTP
jgi:hypothetical protein